MARGQRSATAASERPEAFHGTTQRDIHVSEKGQARPPEGPNTATRISVWRPIPEQTTIRPEPALTEDQLRLKEELRQYVDSELALPSSDPYAKWERIFLEKPDTYPRYLRASKFNLQEAKNRIKGTLEWRRSYKPDLIPPTEIAEEVEGGKVVVNGFDIHGRPIVWLRPSRETTKPSPTQIRHLIWQLERAIDLMPEGVEKMALVVDYKGANNNNNPPMSTAKDVISILQNHYCERLGRAVVINVPWYLNSFFTLLKPFLDPATKDKIKFNPEMKDLVVNEQLDAEFGGQHAFVYDSRVYMPALCSFCGIKEDGTREEKVPKDQPDTRPEELQRRLTSQVDESDRLAEEARQEIDQQTQSAAPAVNGAAAETPIVEQAAPPTRPQEAQGHSGVEQAALASAAGATVIAGGSAIKAAAHASPTDQGQSEIMRILAAQRSGDSTTSAAAAAAAAAAPVPASAPAPIVTMDESAAARSVESAPPVTDAAEPVAASSTARPASPLPSASASAEPIAATSAPISEPVIPASTPGISSSQPLENGPAFAPVNTATNAEKSAPTAQGRGGVKQEGPSSIQERSIPTPAPSTTTTKQPTASKQQKPKGYKKLLAMCGCGSKGAKQNFEDQPREKQINGTGAGSEKPILPAIEINPSSSRQAESHTTAGVGPATQNNRVKIAPEAAAASKPALNVPLATNATFGPEAYQTALEGPEVGDDYFAQGDLRKAHPAPHPQEEGDHAKAVIKPDAIMQRLHTGGSGDLVMAFEVKQPPKDMAEEGEKTVATKTAARSC